MRAVKIIAVSILLALFAGCILLNRPHKSNTITERLETGNGAFKIRVTQYAEENGFPTGAYYVFQSANKGSEDYHDIFTYRHDDPVDIPRDQVRFMNDKVAYVFMGWMYAITTDAGDTWSVWNANTDLSKRACCNRGAVKDVRLAPNGSGTMMINVGDNQEPDLCTTDYGQHWTVDCKTARLIN